MGALTTRKEIRMRLLFTVLAALALLSASACGGGGGQADLTDREITDGELSLMALPLSDLGSQYADFELDDTSGIQTNEQAIESAFDQEDEAADVERFGRVEGYEEDYLSSDALMEGTGPFYISTGVILHETADGASGNLKDGVGDAQRAAGATQENTTLESTETFSVEDVGQEAVGLLQTVSAQGDDGGSYYRTVVGFRQGRLIGTVSILRLDDEDVRDEATALARKLDERILAVLRGEVEEPTPTSEAAPAPTSEATPEATSEATPGPSAVLSPSDVLDSFRFSTEISVEADGGLVLSSEGEFEAPDRMGCTVSASLSGFNVSEDELVVVGDDAWLDTGEGFQATTADDSDVLQDLGLCPGSPTFWQDFTFIQDPGALSGEPDTKNGVDALRYSLGNAAAALESIGFLPSELEGVTINTFDVWVAEDGGWPLAIDVDITADAQAASDMFGLPLAEAGQQARITMRVDITDVNAADIHVEEPLP
jgi:hypothetical protein